MGDRERRMFTNHLGRWHLVSFLVLLGLSTIGTALAVHAGLDAGPHHDRRVIQATCGTFTGPLVGAIARGFQDCCLRFSLHLMLFFGPVLLLSILLQFIRVPDRNGLRHLPRAAWILGWTGWYLGGFLSFGHAFS